MRPCPAVVLALLLLAGVGAGCFDTRPDPLTARLAAPSPFAGPAGADMVEVDVFVIERPAGDDFLNRKLWDLADELAVSLDRKPSQEDGGFGVRQNLEENGFRVGQLGGWAPSGLQALLGSSVSCPDPRRACLHSGHVLPVPLGPVQPRCRFDVFKGGTPTPADLRDAQCRLEIVPQLTDDGRVRLQFTPHIQHGERAVAFGPCQDPSGALRWDRHEDQADSAFPQAGWDVTLAPNEFVAVGANLKRPGTLGHACFLDVGEGGPPVQRLLVLRTNRTLAEAAAAELPPGPASCVAQRAAMTTFHSHSE
jgi:hypothetical protein